MASNNADNCTITVVHGPNKHAVELRALGDEPKVEDLALHLERLTGVPTAKQKLIHKGKSLRTGDDLLSTYGIKNGSRIMLIGKKFNPEDDENFKSIQKVAVQVNNQEKKLTEIKTEIDGILNGYCYKLMENTERTVRDTTGFSITPSSAGESTIH